MALGGQAAIRLQSMTNVHTYDIDRCVAQIEELAKHGCEMVRVAVPRASDTAALPEILRQVSVPIIADVHFHYARALEAVAAGVSKIRLNPGNIKDRLQVEEVISACREQGVAIRVGVNEGSIVERHDQQLHDIERQRDMVELMVEKLAEYVAIFEDNDFDQLVLSAKCHDAGRCIMVNRAISERFDYPVHLGVTHAGDIQTGSIRSAVALGSLLSEGIGDTLRVSLAGDPVQEVEVAKEILCSLSLRDRTGPELIACPTCGRTEIDMVSMVERVKEALTEVTEPVKVAVMGCVVNGPGEAEGADVALCGGKGRAVIYRSGEKVATVGEDEAVGSLIEQVKLFAAAAKS